jgi:hypothetical protein
MIIAFMTTLSDANGLGLSSSVDRALGLSEQVCRIHRHRYASLEERECESDMARKFVGFSIIEGSLRSNVLYPLGPYP